MNRRLLVIFLLGVFVCAVTARAGDVPGAVRLAAADGRFAAGVQLSPGLDGSFELFAGRTDQQAVHPLGRYNGLLAGVATAKTDGEERVLALTRDGSLISHGNENHSLALPDSRWVMSALTVWEDKPLAVTFDGGHLYLVRPTADQGWTRDDVAISRTAPPVRAELTAIDGDLHLLWITRSEGLAGGGIRHAIYRDGKWDEAAPIMLGNVAGFCAFSDEGKLRVAALTADPLDAAPPHTASRVLEDGKWHDAPLPTAVKTALDADPFSFAAGGGLWLSTGTNGAVLIRADSGTQSTLAPPPEGRVSAMAPRFTSLITVLMIFALLLLYCRRSRMLSRTSPEKPPDLLSRGAALGVDWFIASFAMGAYHWASGDVRILPDLMMSGRVQGFFWSNLAGLAFFMLVCEAAFGATPGKALAGLQVASVYGGRPGIMQAVIRNALRAVDMFPVSGAFPGLIGAVSMFLNRARQRTGDVLAGTIVRRRLPLDRRGFLLASASPRRLILLRELGAPVRVEIPNVDEESIKGDTPEETVRLLAEAKARTMVERARPPELVVAADTIVVIDGEILGKPKDEAEAVKMLRRLAGRSHSVFTGVTVWDTASGRGTTDVEETEVEFRNLTDHEIAVYVASGDPLDKAGAYGIQSGHLVSQIRGSLSNVAGLPMEKVQMMIERLGV